MKALEVICDEWKGSAYHTTVPFRITGKKKSAIYKTDHRLAIMYIMYMK